ncbi:MAG: Hpt domain-containing protein [Desulfamplus sp.]
MDLKAMASNIGLDEEDFIELLEMLVNVSLTDIKNFETALASGNYTSAAMSAHSIKGASANLGLTDISAVAAELEKASKNSDPSSIPEKIASLKHQLNHISETLK